MADLPSAEDVAREVDHAIVHAVPLVEAVAIRAVAAIIEADRAEVRADERARVLAEFTEERVDYVDQSGACSSRTHNHEVKDWAAEDCRFPVTEYRRLVGPWQSIDPEETS